MLENAFIEYANPATINDYRGVGKAAGPSQERKPSNITVPPQNYGQKENTRKSWHRKLQAKQDSNWSTRPNNSARTYIYTNTPNCFFALEDLNSPSKITRTEKPKLIRPRRISYYRILSNTTNQHQLKERQITTQTERSEWRSFEKRTQ